MDNQTIIDAIARYQQLGYVHPLTCGNNSMHTELIGKEVDGKVVLVCPDCDYIQKWVPEFAIESGLNCPEHFPGLEPSSEIKDGE